mmetsp:Transcript_24490/g.64385  ORF Transcript_24490/g.64385 Transcript_24490/m.64385 type:complete len:229 (+) Transcript_24490:783-1469(+)
MRALLHHHALKDLQFRTSPKHHCSVEVGWENILDEGRKDPECTHLGTLQQQHRGNKIKALTIADYRVMSGECQEHALQHGHVGILIHLFASPMEIELNLVTDVLRHVLHRQCVIIHSRLSRFLSSTSRGPPNVGPEMWRTTCSKCSRDLRLQRDRKLHVKSVLHALVDPTDASKRLFLRIVFPLAQNVAIHLLVQQVWMRCQQRIPAGAHVQPTAQKKNPLKKCLKWP